MNIPTIALAAALTLPVASGAFAQAPTSPITLIVPHAAGTGVDVLARSFAPAMEKALNASIVAENRPGANGSIGSVAVARSAPDGRTLLLAANPPFITFPMTQETALYDAEKDFTPIAIVGSVPMVLVVSPDSGLQNLDQFIDYVRANPKLANYASPGPGSAGQLAMQKLQALGDFKIEHVLYKSTPQSLTDVAAGHMLSAFVSVPAATPLLQGGKLKALAVGSAEPLTALPGVPTLKQATGQDDFEASVWYGFFGPANMPDDLVNTLYRGLAAAQASPETRKTLEGQSIVPNLLDPAASREVMTRDTAEARTLMQGGN